MVNLDNPEEEAVKSAPVGDILPPILSTTKAAAEVLAEIEAATSVFFPERERRVELLGVSLIPPVVVPPNVNVWFAVVCNAPVAVRKVPPAVPADNEAVGVPPATFNTANFAKIVVEELVADPPTRRSKVLLVGNRIPFAESRTHLETFAVEQATDPVTIPPVTFKQGVALRFCPFEPPILIIEFELK